MKKKRLLFLGFIFIFLFSFSGVFNAGAAEVELSFAHIFPASHYQAGVFKQWAEEVEAVSKGHIKINMFPRAAAFL
jgi:TRAP-type C4-dicarboxylate transport system substrate-binding protein